MNEQQQQRQYGILPHGASSASRLKRKDREHQQLPPSKRHPPPPPPPPRAAVPTKTSTKGFEMNSSNNKLVAGYMAFEFLTKGTVLGNKIDRSETAKVIENERYRELTSLLMMKSDSGGYLLPGVVNPAELVRWIEMKL
ncbi:hypothetical protein QVD17_15075 [Tagetes erecta]|uniref:Uncharacterized protein n=1 Tax=Tagetes erecta TaxID=13708 RepID=A0AAD8KNN3_TARER|nr:hypothetical protein QVD17_15075 [Tagetes erecta]